MLQQVVGITPQRHDRASVTNPVRGGRGQYRLREETRAKRWREENLARIPQPILQILLPQRSSCPFWANMEDYLLQFQNQQCLVNLPTIPMPYYNEEALLPLPASPQEGFRSGLSLYPVAIDEDHPGSEEEDPVQEQG